MFAAVEAMLVLVVMVQVFLMTVVAEPVRIERAV